MIDTEREELALKALEVFPGLVDFAIEMYFYQKKLNNECQCGDCTFTEPFYGEVIKAAIDAHLNNQGMDTLAGLANRIEGKWDEQWNKA